MHARLLIPVVLLATGVLSQNACKPGEVSVNGMCMPLVGPGGACQNGMVLLNNQCVPKTPLGSSCFIAAQCGENAMCNNDKLCACNVGYHAMHGYCVRQTEGGNCPLGQVSVNGACLSLASAGQQCISSLQCIDDTSCVNGACACSKQNEHVVQGFCVLPGTLQGCDYTQTLVSNQCMTYSMIGGQCTGSQQCVGGSICPSQRCSCPSGTVPMYGYCITDTSSGNSGGCAQNQANLSRHPITPYLQVFVSGICHNRVDLGSTCFVSQQCNQGTCTSNICTIGGTGGCANGQVLVGGMCLTRVQPGGLCIVPQQCIGGEKCDSGICSGSSKQNCKSFQVRQQPLLAPRAPQSVLHIGPGAVDPLTRRKQIVQQCMGFGVCRSSICTCPSSFSAVNGVCRNILVEASGCPAGQVKSPSGACLLMVNPGSFCDITQQCIGGGSCENGICKANSSATCADPSKEVVYTRGQPIDCMVQQCPSGATCEFAQQNFVCCRARMGSKGTDE